MNLPAASYSRDKSDENTRGLSECYKSSLSPMRKLKSDYANKLNSLKQAKKALQMQYIDKENYCINQQRGPFSKKIEESNVLKASKAHKISKNMSPSSCTSDDEYLVKNDRLSPIHAV